MASLPAEVVVLFSPGQQALVVMAALLSLLGSCSFVASYFIFWAEVKSQGVQSLMAFMFISTALNSLGLVGGFPNLPNGYCWFQGIVTNVFTLAAVLWTLVILWAVFSTIRVASKGTSPQPLKTIPIWMHVVCWGLPLAVTLFPLVNATYAPPHVGSSGWCWLNLREGTPVVFDEVWYWVSFYGVLWGAIILVVLIGAAVAVLLSTISHPAARAQSYTTVLTLMGYPLAFVAAWLYGCAVDYTDVEGTPESYFQRRHLFFSSSVVACLHGFFASLVFWISDSKFKGRWRRFYLAGFSREVYVSEVKRERTGGVEITSRRRPPGGKAELHDHPEGWDARHDVENSSNDKPKQPDDNPVALDSDATGPRHLTL